MNALAVLVTRLDHSFAARVLGQLAFVFAEGERTARSEAEVRVLQSSLEKGGWENTRSFVWNAPIDEARCWHKGDGWALSFEEPAA